MIPSTVQGTVATTGAAVNVVLGYFPDYVKVVNRATGAEMTWMRTAGIAGGSIVIANTGGRTLATGANSISTYTVATGAVTGDGFTIPVNATVNISGNPLDYFCARSGPGSV